MARLNYPTAILLAGLLVWVLFSASLFITANDNHNIRSAAYVSPLPLPTIMAIKTHKTSIKEKPTKAGSSSVVHPARRITRSTPQSPKENRVNSLLTDINRPQNRFEGALAILGTLDDGTENLDDPCNLVPPIIPAENIGTGATVRIDDSPPQVYAPDSAVHAHVSNTHPAPATPVTQGEIIQILDDNEEDDASVLTTKTQDELVALLVKARRAHQVANAGLRAASGSGHLPGNGLVATPPHPDAGGQKTCPTSNAHDGDAGVAVGTEVSSGPGGK
jgi:hypothetical protein